MFLKEATTRQNLGHLSVGDRLIGFLWEVQIRQNVCYTIGESGLIQHIAVVRESLLPLGALHDEADDLEHQLQHLLGSNLRALAAKLERVICSSEVSLVLSKEVCVAGLQQPSGFLRHKAELEVKPTSRSQNGGMQVHIATVQQQQKGVRGSELLHCFG